MVAENAASFLEFVATRLLGRPVGDGCRLWECPHCAKRALAVNPPLGNYKIKYRCFACREWGDEKDLVQLVLPGAGWHRWLTVLGDLGAEWEWLSRGGAGGGTGGPVDTPSFSPTGVTKGPSPIDWQTEAERYAKHLSQGDRFLLAEKLGIPCTVPRCLPLLGWDRRRNVWTIPEIDADDRVIGIATRLPSGKGPVLAGGRRGLVVPNGWGHWGSPYLVAEGASDTLAAHAANLSCIGRSSAAANADLIAEFFGRHLKPGEEVVILGDGDDAGRDGARRVAGKVAAKLANPVHWATTPDELDLRDWLTSMSGRWHERRKAVLEYLAGRKAVAQ